jgi:cysteine desulfurase
MQRLYFDYNASTPLAPEVIRVMRGLLDEGFGNPSSTHWAGRSASDVVEHGRSQVAHLLGCRTNEIVLTSGGSEANNLALKGVFFSRRHERPHIVTTCVEHPAILSPCRFLERLGARITYLRVDRNGLIDPDDMTKAITPDTILVSVMHANNEVGTIQPIEQCARLARDRGILFHTDAAQSVGKIRTRVDELGIDLLSVAGHKF